MADPTAYTVSYSFTDYQTASPSDPLPAAKIDIEYANISTSLASLRTSLMDVRRSDGALTNGIVTKDSLALDLKIALVAASDLIITPITVTDLTALTVGATGLDYVFGEKAGVIVKHEPGALMAAEFAAASAASSGTAYLVGLDGSNGLVKTAPGFVKVTDYGVASADFTEAYTAAAAPVFVPHGSYTIATDVTGEFFSFGHVPVDATGAVYVKDLLSAVTTPKQKAARNIEIIAHRGFKSQFPQNTLLAASAAALSGAHAIECDVSVSSDGTLYCFHDATVDALTDGTGTFTALTDAYIDARVFDEVVGTSYSNITMGKFADILQVCREFGLKIYPEVKAYRTQADIALMVTAVEDAGMDEMCVFQSSTFSDLTYIRSTIGSNVGVGFLGAGTTGYEPYIRDLAELGNGTLFWNYSDVISAPAIVDHCFNRGVDLCVFTLTTAEDARKVARLGVNKMMSDVWLGI